jgi:dimethylargininase
MHLGQRTHVARSAIDYDRAVRQHAEYCRMLRRCGVQVRTLDVNRELPDCVFVEDTAVVLDEVAVLASMGVESRRDEPAGIEPELRKFREVHRIEPPATLEGGDVLQLGRTLLIGISSRTNRAGLAALEAITRRYGYRAVPVAVQGCLHLKTACTALPDGSLLANPDWVDMEDLRGFDTIRIPEYEPWGANTLSIGQKVCVAAEQVRTADLLRARGFEVETVELYEFAKAEGGITCLSILFDK